MNIFNQKDPSEIVTLTFDYTPLLLPGELLTGTPIVTIGLYSGVTDPQMQTILSGVPQISGSYILQQVKFGVTGNKYDMRSECNTNEGRHLVVEGLFPVVWSLMQ